MNRITDLLFSAQLSTMVACLFTYWAHLIENGTVLNANWGFMVYVLLAFATVLIMLPHLISQESPCTPTTKHNHSPTS